MEKFKLLFWRQVIEAVAEKIDFLLYKPASQVFPGKNWKETFIQLHFLIISSLANKDSTESADLRLAVGKSEDEV